MGIERIIRVLLARWKILISVFLVAGVIGVAIAYKMPKTYIASAVVVVESRVDPVVGVSQLMAPNFLATQVDIIRSSRVSNKVIKGLNLTENPTLKQQYQEAKTNSLFWNGSPGFCKRTYWLSQVAGLTLCGFHMRPLSHGFQIGRASCRERVLMPV